MVARESLPNRYNQFAAPLMWFRETTPWFPEPAPIRTYAHTHFFSPRYRRAPKLLRSHGKNPDCAGGTTHCRASERRQRTANFRLDTTADRTTSNGTVRFTGPYCSKIACTQYIVTVITSL